MRFLYSQRSSYVASGTGVCKANNTPAREFRETCKILNLIPRSKIGIYI
jgi:hypothetical protein